MPLISLYDFATGPAVQFKAYPDYDPINEITPDCQMTLKLCECYFFFFWLISPDYGPPHNCLQVNACLDILLVEFFF